MKKLEKKKKKRTTMEFINCKNGLGMEKRKTLLSDIRIKD